LCIGCNYPTKAFGLAGAVNDAFLISDYLQTHCGFAEENVCILHDVIPGQKKSVQVDETSRPTRVNILQKLQWLVRSAKPGDVSFFSFSGYGLQVDDIDSMPDEGLEEAVLPTDFQEGCGSEYSVIVCSEIHDVLAGIPSNSSVTVLMDCDHATSIADVSGTVDGQLLSGVKEHAYCGVKAHTAKVQLSEHRREVWQEERARQVKARPRFQPSVEIQNPRKGRLPTRPAMARSTPIAFCFSASGHGQTAMELQVQVERSSQGGKEQKKQYGVLSWCFVEALRELRCDCNYLELLNAIRKHMAAIKQRDLPRMDQEGLLTFTTPLSDPRMKVLQPVQGKLMSRPPLPGGSCAVPVVPPPPAGYIKGGSLQLSAPAPKMCSRSNSAAALPTAVQAGSESDISPRPPSPPRPSHMAMSDAVSEARTHVQSYSWQPPASGPCLHGLRLPSSDSPSSRGLQVGGAAREVWSPIKNSSIARANGGLGNGSRLPDGLSGDATSPQNSQSLNVAPGPCSGLLSGLSNLAGWFSYQPPSVAPTAHPQMPLRSCPRPQLPSEQQIEATAVRHHQQSQAQRQLQPQQPTASQPQIQPMPQTQPQVSRQSLQGMQRQQLQEQILQQQQQQHGRIAQQRPCACAYAIPPQSLPMQPQMRPPLMQYPQQPPSPPYVQQPCSQVQQQAGVPNSFPGSFVKLSHGQPQASSPRLPASYSAPFKPRSNTLSPSPTSPRYH